MLIEVPKKIDLQTHPIFKKMTEECGFEQIDSDSFEAFLKKDGLSLILFVDDPNRMKETMDAIVIAPELAKSCQLIKNKAVICPPQARKLSAIYGFKRWPAMVFVRDGAYLGAVDGLRLWSQLVAEVDEIIQRSPSFPPSIGIPVKSC